MDYIGVKRFDADGKLVGEFRIVGLFTSTAYTRSTRSIPYLRRKVDAVVKRAGFDPEGHSGKALVNVLENYPRDELFQIDEDTLYQFAMAVLQLDERPRVRVLPRRDRFDRFVSVLVYVPRERYDSDVRKAIGDYLARAYKGRVSAFHPFFPEGPLVRVHFIIGVPHGDDAQSRSRRAWRARSRRSCAPGSTRSATSLWRGYDPARARGAARALSRRVLAGLSRESIRPRYAVADIRLIEGLSPSRPLGVDFHRRAGDQDTAVGLKVWSHEPADPAVRAGAGAREHGLQGRGRAHLPDRSSARRPEQTPTSGSTTCCSSAPTARAIDLEATKHGLEAAFLVVMSGGAENDGYNALVLAAGMMWRDVALIRTVSRFLRQIRVPYSQDYMWTTLVKHRRHRRRHRASVPRALRSAPRFIGGGAQAPREAAVAAAIEAALQQVESLDEDRILRRFVNAVQAAIRTNFYQIDAAGPAEAADRASSSPAASSTALPLPRPLYEIFVYSPARRGRASALRQGRARRHPLVRPAAGLPHRSARPGQGAAGQERGHRSGRRQGRLRAEAVAADGGTREAVQAEGTAAYKLFISTLLDITDNLGPSGVVPPANVVRHDDDDPYLVVAADKGTATFSDIANAIAQEHGFWLDDAFASGGSAGYDHKKMGITARGAWESVKRHFREMDVDIGRTPFTVVGVGDMSGDVFGNGMLRERTIKLVAAFDHRDIFIDPAPDPGKSFAERTRLFALPRSSWQDYDKALISKGGGVFSRALKEIALSDEAQAVLGSGRGQGDAAGGDEGDPEGAGRSALLRRHRHLCARLGRDRRRGRRPRQRCDPHHRRRHPRQGDRRGRQSRHDPARPHRGGVARHQAQHRRHRQFGRRQHFRRRGQPQDRAGEADARRPACTREARNALLADMTDDVAALVLRNNYLQTLAISLAERRGLEDLGFQQRLMQTLEAAGELDRAVEFLPDDMEIAERRRRSQALTRPELAVLLAYAKLALNHELLQSNVPDDPYLGRELGRYFPKAVTEQFPDALEQHRLRREIIATQLANSMINRGGPSLLVRIADQTGAAAASIAAAFAAVRDSYDMTRAQRRDRRARQQDLRQAAARAL